MLLDDPFPASVDGRTLHLVVCTNTSLLIKACNRWGLIADCLPGHTENIPHTMKYSKPFFAVAKTLFPLRFSPISHLDSFGLICSTILLTCFPAVLSSDLGSKTKQNISILSSWVWVTLFLYFLIMQFPWKMYKKWKRRCSAFGATDKPYWSSI